MPETGRSIKHKTQPTQTSEYVRFAPIKKPAEKPEPNPKKGQIKPEVPENRYTNNPRTYSDKSVWTGTAAHVDAEDGRYRRPLRGARM